MGGWTAGTGGTLILSLILAGTLLYPGWPKQGIALAEQKAEMSVPVDKTGVAAASGQAAEYHTPLAGESFHTVFMGKTVDIPARNRGHVNALLLGGVFYTPKQGETSGSPLGAIYLKRMWEKSRTRNVICFFVNDLEYDRSFGNLELVTRFENNTLPVGQKEVVNNQEIKSSDAVWGTVLGSLGTGLRYKVAPFQVDNDLRLQLLGKVGYFYANRTDDTGPNLVLPPSTILYGVKLRGRYDGMRRNLYFYAKRTNDTGPNLVLPPSTMLYGTRIFLLNALAIAKDFLPKERHFATHFIFSSSFLPVFLHPFSWASSSSFS